jgi:hypothetical protein
MSRVPPTEVTRYAKVGCRFPSAIRLMGSRRGERARRRGHTRACSVVALISNVQRASTAHDEIAQFMATRDGLALAKAFIRISSRQMRQEIVSLVEELTPAKTDGAAQRRA